MPIDPGLTLGLIPARGGSKGVAAKNLRKFGGRSLVERAVAACLNSGVVDHVLVSTDNELIADEARQAGAEVPFLRPPELAADDTLIQPVIDHAIHSFENFIGRAVTTIAFTEPTVPFRNAGHIASAIERYREGDVSSVISVCPLERKPHNIFLKSADARLDRYIKQPRQKFSRRQDMDALCRLSSGVYVIGRDEYMRTKSLIVEPLGFITMTNMESINIDEEFDVLIAEAVSTKYGL